jgi:hypothetical protein
MVAVPYCNSCRLKVDPTKANCPRCGAPVRFKILRQKNAARLEGDEEKEGSGYIRPHSS